MKTFFQAVDPDNGAIMIVLGAGEGGKQVPQILVKSFKGSPPVTLNHNAPEALAQFIVGLCKAGEEAFPGYAFNFTFFIDEGKKP